MNSYVMNIIGTTPGTNLFEAEGAWGGASWQGFLNVGGERLRRRSRDRKSGFFQVLPYDPKWEIIATFEKQELLRNLSGCCVVIEHVGSTSIPGMSTKPIIQLNIGVSSAEERNKALEILRDRGWLATTPSGWFLDKKSSLKTTVGIAVCVVIYGDPYWQSRILFREFLKTHPYEFETYKNLKISNYNKGFGFDEYTKAKEQFIYETMIKAGFPKELMVEARVVDSLPDDHRVPLPRNDYREIGVSYEKH